MKVAVTKQVNRLRLFHFRKAGGTSLRSFVRELAKQIPFYNIRHSVKPGITGWAQLCYPYGSNEQDAKEKLQFDLYYVKNQSLFLDFTILLTTVEVILFGKGAR